MMLKFFLEGAAVGLAVAAPVGPTTVLVVHRTVRQGYKKGLASGFGAAAADAFFGLLAAFSVGFVASFLLAHEFYIKLVGGFFLIYWGQRLFTLRFMEVHPLVKGEGAGGPVVSTFALTLTNPMTVLAFVGALAGLGITHVEGDFSAVFYIILGLGAGSFLWWLIISSLAEWLKERFSNEILLWVNRVTGIAVIAAGALVLLKLV